MKKETFAWIAGLAGVLLVLAFAGIGVKESFSDFSKDERVPYVLPEHSHGDKVVRLDCSTCNAFVQTAGGNLQKIYAALNDRISKLEGPSKEAPMVGPPAPKASETQEK